MYKIELKNFDILINTDSVSITAFQSGGSFNTGFDNKLLSVLKKKLSEFLSILDATVNIPNNATILDIGAGNSLFDIALAKTYPNSNFILVDGNNFDPLANKGIQHSSTYQTYNSWDPVFRNIELNGLDPAKFKTIDPSNIYWADDSSCDIVMSTSSWGWHYPIETYLQQAHKLLKPGGYLIVRPLLNVNNSLKTVSDLFGPAVHLKGYPMSAGSFTPFEKQNWISIIDSNEPDYTMFYHAIWQKPLTI